MKSIAHWIISAVVSAIVTAIILYAAFFMFWAALISVCMAEADARGSEWQACGANAMTDAVQVLYSPFIK